MRTTIVGVVNVRGLLGVTHCACQYDTVMATGTNCVSPNPFVKAGHLDYFHCEISHCTAGGYVESSDVFLVLRLYLVLVTEQREKFTKLGYSVSHNFHILCINDMLNTKINSKFVHLLAGLSS